MATSHGLRKNSAKAAACLLSLALAALSAFPELVAAQPAAQVSAPVSVRSISIKGDEIRIGLDGRTAYEDFILSHPSRVVLQISNTAYRLPEKVFRGRAGAILKDVRAGQFSTAPTPIVRVVLDLAKAAAYRVATEGNDLVVILAARAASAAVSAAAPTPAAIPTVAVARVAPAAAPAAMAAQAAPEAPVAQAAPNPEVAAMAQDSNDEAPTDLMDRLPKDKITVDFDQTDIHDILQLFATKARINIIYGPDVTGQLTLHLNRVPFDEAFRTVLDMLNLTTTQVGDSILRVLTPETLAKVQTAAATATQIIPLNYSKASDLVSTLQQIISAEKIPGLAIADSKTNSIIITASPDSLSQIGRLVEQLDIRPKQVLIEAKLIEVTLDNTFNYGIEWNETSQGTNNGGTDYTGLPLTLQTSPVATNSQFPLGLANTLTGAQPTLGTITNGSGVALGAANPFGALTLGRITSHYILNATLSAAAALGKVKILSDPKIATLNNQPANINVVTNIPYVTTTVVPGNTGSGATVPETVNYATEGIELTVTPIINADGRITLTINPSISQPSATAANNEATGAPAIDTRSAQTTVMVKDGDTVVIGGLVHDSITDQVNKIPLLGDIPLLGWLFKSVSKEHTRDELLIFVTPKIIAD